MRENDTMNHGVVDPSPKETADDGRGRRNSLRLVVVVMPFLEITVSSRWHGPGERCFSPRDETRCTTCQATTCQARTPILTNLVWHVLPVLE